MEAKSIVDQVSTLFSLPEVCEQLGQLLETGKCEISELAELIGYDPTLTARLLQLANGTEFSGPAVETITDAIARIGTDRLSDLLASTASTSAFREMDPEIVDMENFWHHSVCCGLASTSLARHAGYENPERLFIPGLLHDIGQLIIYQAKPEFAAKVLADSRQQESYRYLMEKQLMGVTHAQVGQELLSRWAFPTMIQKVVEFHHEPNLAGDYEIESSIVHIATAIANCVEPSWKMNNQNHDARRQINAFAWQATGLTPEVIESTLSEVCVESLNILGVIDPASASIY